MNADTDEDDIAKNTRLDEGTQEQLAEALGEEARLAGSDPSKEKARLAGVANALERLKEDLSAATATLGTDAGEGLQAARSKAATLRQAATAAAGVAFDDEQLAGVGAAAWRTLWQAARNYSVGEAYHGHDFPHTEPGARCVLCQQQLTPDGATRLRRFEAFVTDTTEREASEAERRYSGQLSRLRSLVISTSQTTNSLNLLSQEDAELATDVRALTAELEDRKTAIIAWAEQEGVLPEAAITKSGALAQLGALASSLKSRSLSIDTEQFQLSLKSARDKKEQLESAVRLHEAADAVRAEVQRKREHHALRLAWSAADTSSITQKSAQLARTYTNELVRDQFTRECERLSLRRVTLQDKGGRKGQLSQQPGLLGAQHRLASTPVVLSEGEQTALGLAGFFTEAEFEQSKSALVLDDPVTSLDHMRRDNVAQRLVQLAAGRQVVVFTHDISFVGDLDRQATEQGVPWAERSIERRGDDSPGLCKDSHPWKAKDINARINVLEQKLAIIRKNKDNFDTAEYETLTGEWGGLLSETWERCVTAEILNQVFDRGRSEVRPLKFRLFAKITEADSDEFNVGYGRASKWSRRHDKADVVNYTPPTVEDMAAEIGRIRTWQKRMHGYVK